MNGFEAVMTAATTNIFPVVVAAYLLVRMETELRALRTAIEALRHCPHCVHSPCGDKEISTNKT